MNPQKQKVSEQNQSSFWNSKQGIQRVVDNQVCVKDTIKKTAKNYDKY